MLFPRSAVPLSINRHHIISTGSFCFASPFPQTRIFCPQCLPLPLASFTQQVLLWCSSRSTETAMLPCHDYLCLTRDSEIGGDSSGHHSVDWWILKYLIVEIRRIKLIPSHWLRRNKERASNRKDNETLKSCHLLPFKSIHPPWPSFWHVNLRLPHDTTQFQFIICDIVILL